MQKLLKKIRSLEKDTLKCLVYNILSGVTVIVKR